MLKNLNLKTKIQYDKIKNLINTKEAPGFHPLNFIERNINLEYDKSKILLLISGGWANSIIKNNIHFHNENFDQLKDIDFFLLKKKNMSPLYLHALPNPIFRHPSRNIYLDCINDKLLNYNNQIYYRIDSSYKECAINTSDSYCYYSAGYENTVINKILSPPGWWKNGKISSILNGIIEDMFRPIRMCINNDLRFSGDMVNYLNELFQYMMEFHGEFTKRFYASRINKDSFPGATEKIEKGKDKMLMEIELFAKNTTGMSSELLEFIKWLNNSAKVEENDFVDTKLYAISHNFKHGISFSKKILES